LGSFAGAAVGETDKGLTATPPAVCTSVCTSQRENANADDLDRHPGAPSPDALDNSAPGPRADGEGTDQAGADPLAGLAAAIAALSPTDRVRLAEMLTEYRREGETKAGTHA
jgi:hypothetical protein